MQSLAYALWPTACAFCGREKVRVAETPHRHCERLGHWLLALLLAISVGLAAAGAIVTTPRLHAELVSETATVVAGRPFWVALCFIQQPGWHTYWQNPGDSGEAPRIRWQLPAGFCAGDIQWPPPQRLPVGSRMNHGYSGEAWLPVVITPPDQLVADRVTLQAAATWLVCKEDCIPERGEFALTVPVGPASPSAAAPPFEELRRRLPKPLAGATWRQADGRLHPLLTGLSTANLREVWFFAEEYGLLDHTAAPGPVTPGILAALAMAQAELKAGKPVSVPVTRPYGCSVKY